MSCSTDAPGAATLDGAQDLLQHAAFAHANEGSRSVLLWVSTARSSG
jgi:hypothetical protein